MVLPSAKKNCPDCGHALGATAYKCRCGWKSDGATETAAAIPCVFTGCPEPALARVKTPTGMANACRKCYGRLWTPALITEVYQVKPSSPETKDIRMGYLGSYAYRNGNPGAIGGAIRVPGQDDEERVAA